MIYSTPNAFFFCRVVVKPLTAEDDDFVEKIHNVTFFPGDTKPKSIPVDIIDDKLVEQKERFVVSLASYSPATSVGKPAFVDIIDNDGMVKYYSRVIVMIIRLCFEKIFFLIITRVDYLIKIIQWGVSAISPLHTSILGSAHSSIQ